MTISAFNPPDNLSPQDLVALLRSEIERWAEGTTKTNGDREARLFEKVAAVTGFFALVGGPPQDVWPPDVRIWCDALEAGGRTASTIRDYVGFLSSFFEWLDKSSAPGSLTPRNPTKVLRRQPANAASADDWQERTEALISRVRSMRVGNTLNLRDFSADVLDELEELLGYHRINTTQLLIQCQ